MSQKQKVAIYSDALQRELEKRGLSNPEVSKAMGFKDPGYMANALREGMITLQSVILLEQIYRIDPEIYLVPEEPAEAPEEPLEGQISMAEAGHPLEPTEMETLIRWSVAQLCQAISESASELAGPMKRIAEALEGNNEPQVLPWNTEITDEEAGGTF